MKEIPIPYVRANQTGIVLLVVLAIIFQQPFLIAALWAIQVIGLWQGVRANLIVQLAAPLLHGRIAGAQTEAAELQRFNNSIAVILLTLSVVSFWLMPGSWVGYLFAGMVAAAAFVAICGFCVGCFFIFPIQAAPQQIK